ncbi:MAG: adenine-specific methyltransferase EcoRI family protein [Treponema sp.]|jgi:hypothetical protein|nr:adenine-specific methyltransferase EcoRI family protein [Treponema sp.]
MAKSDKLRNAKAQKNDEFYTQLSDIEKECNRYEAHFRGKTILCNCDDPFTSEFFKYFAMRFNLFGLKRLISASYDPSPIAGTQLPFEEIAGMQGSGKKAYVFDSTEMPNNLEDTKLMMKTVKEVVRPLQGNGDFRSSECIELLKQADIVVTNPPFSLFREFAAQLVEYEKKFLIIGNINAVSYKEIFPLIKENKLWLGVSIHSGDREFAIPAYYETNSPSLTVYPDGHRTVRVPGVRWFTNLDHKGRHEDLLLWKKYTPDEYPRYDNYDAIEVGKVTEIPIDYDGVMGVPVSFLDKYNPAQFVIIGEMANTKIDDFNKGYPFINGQRKYARILIRRRQA